MTYGKDGILKDNPKDILINSAFLQDIKGSEIFFKTLQIADIAWALTLYKAGMFRENFDELLDALIDLEKFELDPKYGDIYNSKNIALKKRTKYAKNIHFSRPRREAINVAFYIKLKESLKEFFDVAKELADLFLRVAKKKNFLMSDYTYLQQAQPTTFGHYILTFVFPLIRDLERLELLDKHLSFSPAGSGSVNGCSIDIDQKYLAKLLGFKKVESHARDSMWRSDLVVESIVRIESILANLNRLVEELIIFATSEFSLITLPSSLSRASVIMPNKQNPYALTYFRGLTNEILGKVVSYFSYEKIASGNPDSRTFVYVDLIESIDKAKMALKLLSVVLDEMKLNKKVLKKRIKNSFFYATEIAEHLVKHQNLTYEEAHNEVGRVIRYMRENGIKPKDIKEEYFNYKVDLKELIDPKKSIKNKKTIGSVGDLENIIKKAKKRLKKLKFEKNDFSFLNKELERFQKDVKFT